jgi:hypothetical protein
MHLRNLGCAFAIISFLSTRLHSIENGVVIELFENYGTYTLAFPPPDMNPIQLVVPQGFGYASSTSTLRTWSADLLTFYPSFSKPSDPGNLDYGMSCGGFCNGRIVISIQNRTHSIEPFTPSPNMGDFIASTTIKWKRTPPYPTNVHVFDIPPIDNFDDAFARVTYPFSQTSNALLGTLLLRRNSTSIKASMGFITTS